MPRVGRVQQSWGAGSREELRGRLVLLSQETRPWADARASSIYCPSPSTTQPLLPAGLCKQLLRMGWPVLPPPRTLSIPSPEPRPGLLRKIG